MQESEGVIQATLDRFLREEREREGPRPTACGTALRGSSAHNCARQLGFEVARVAECERMPYETLLAFHIGHAMHERVQTGLHALWPDFQSEVKCDLRPFGYDLSGHADGLMVEGNKSVVVEIKTMGAFPFKLALKGGKGEPPGPKIEHLLQSGIYAAGLQADGVCLVYISKETSYRDGVLPGMMLEFYVGMDEVVEPYDRTLRELVIEELDRMQGIWEQVQAGQIPERYVPGHGHVDPVPRYQGGSKEQPWNCRYCRWRSDCAALPVEAVPVEVATDNVRGTWNPPVDTVDPEAA